MEESNLDKALDRTKSIFKLVNLASMRAIEISDGEKKMVDADKGARALDVAIREINNGKVSYIKAKKDGKKRKK